MLIPSESVFAWCDLEGNVSICSSDGATPTDSSDTHCGYVELWDSTRTLIDSCCIDVNYDYSFYDLPDGEYTVRVVCAKRLTGIITPSCTDKSWFDSIRVTISSEPYKRADICLTSNDGTVSTGCCHRCPCHD